MDGILPAAGLATRMRGLPKFLLPVNSEYETLIERQISKLREVNCGTIWIPTRPEFIILLESILASQEQVIIFPLESKTMNETVIKVLDVSGAEHFALAMPDTYFLSENPFKVLNSVPAIAEVGCWKIRDKQRGKLGQVLVNQDNLILDIVDKDYNCDYELAWGCLTFSRDLTKYIDVNDPHIGYALRNAMKSNDLKIQKVEGDYFDCGTASEYIELLLANTN